MEELPHGGGDARTRDRQPGGRPGPLRRRSRDKVIAGVCGGLADRFGINVLAVRIVFGFAGLVVAFMLIRPFLDAGLTSYVSKSRLVSLRELVRFGSALGVIAYAGLWVFVPSEDEEASAARRAVGHLPRASGFRTWIGMLALVLGASLLGAFLGLWTPDVTWAFLLIGVGVLLFHRDAERRRADHAEPETGLATLPNAAPAIAPPPPRERSALGWLTFGIALLVVGGAATLQDLGAMHLRVVRFPALFVLILGFGMLVGSWFGRARWLVLPVLVVAPAMLLVSLIQVPLEGGFGGVHAYVRSADEMRPAYRAVWGNVFVDLTALACRPQDRISLSGSTGYGTVTLYVPFDARVVASAASGLGTLYLGTGPWPSGAGISAQRTLEPRFGNGPTIVADLQAGLGNVEVLRQGLTERQRKKACA